MEIARSNVTLNINGHRYDFFCAREDAEGLRRNGALLAERINAIVAEKGQIGEAPLMILALLELIAELRDKKRFEKLWELGTYDFETMANVRWQMNVICSLIARRVEHIAAYLEEITEEKEDALRRQSGQGSDLRVLAEDKGEND